MGTWRDLFVPVSPWPSYWIERSYRVHNRVLDMDGERMNSPLSNVIKCFLFVGV